MSGIEGSVRGNMRVVMLIAVRVVTGMVMLMGDAHIAQISPGL